MKRTLSIILIVILAIPLCFSYADTRLLGDCDGDGNLGADDASSILRHIVYLDRLAGADWYAADVDQNGNITAYDASCILRHVVHLSTITSEPIELPPMISELRLGLIEAELDLDETISVPFTYELNNAAPIFEVGCSNNAVLSVIGRGSNLDVTAIGAGEAFVTVTDTVSHHMASARFVVSEFDNELYSNIVVGLYGSTFAPEDMSQAQKDSVMALYDYILDLDPLESSTQIIFAGLELMGTPYNVLDCSNFTRRAYADAGYGKVICGGSENQIQLFRDNGCLFEFPVDEGGDFDCSQIAPAYVLLWVDSSGKGNHSALYLGNINGSDWLLESATSIGGVGIRRLWSTGTWRLKYYADPLGD
ncbi:MAG: dockerin type I domain-containing protein [Eubacteriales bacterium]|nr:dockerin type I domain-containing protein [Eubacteriales bacterium]